MNIFLFENYKIFYFFKKMEKKEKENKKENDNEEFDDEKFDDKKITPDAIEAIEYELYLPERSDKNKRIKSLRAINVPIYDAKEKVWIIGDKPEGDNPKDKIPEGNNPQDRI